MKSKIVNNYFLSFIALYYKLNEFIIFDNEYLADKLENISKKLPYFADNIQEYFSTSETSIKVLADVFEALIGSIFLDTNCNFTLIETIVMRLCHKFIIKFTEKKEI